MRAIDISYCQTENNFRELAKEVNYIIIKASQGCFVNGTGSFFVDKTYRRKAELCIKNHIPFGFYHFFTAKDKEAAIVEAKKFCSAINPYKKYVGYVYLDCENYGNVNLLSQNKKQLTDSCNAFMDYCESAGYLPVLYTNPDHLSNCLNAGDIKRPLWIAKYGSTKPNYKNLLLWQYGTGYVEGVGTCDLDECYMKSSHMAIMELAYKGFIENVGYWTKRCDNSYSGIFLTSILNQANSVFEYGVNKDLFVASALRSLEENGIRFDSDYARHICSEDKNVKSLFLRLGCGIAYGV